jgi:hypothetical protein
MTFTRSQKTPAGLTSVFTDSSRRFNRAKGDTVQSFKLFIAGFGGHFRAVQGFKYLGESANYESPGDNHNAHRLSFA